MKYISLLVMIIVSNNVLAQLNRMIVNSGPNGFGFSYAPTMIKDEGGVIHNYFCSAGHNAQGKDPKSKFAVDVIRYVSSSDGGANWSKPEVKLLPNIKRDLPWSERSNCDPNMIHYRGYYYLYYSGAPASQLPRAAWHSANGNPYC